MPTAGGHSRSTQDGPARNRSNEAKISRPPPSLAAPVKSASRPSVCPSKAIDDECANRLPFVFLCAMRRANATRGTAPETRFGFALDGDLSSVFPCFASMPARPTNASWHDSPRSPLWRCDPHDDDRAFRFPLCRASSSRTQYGGRTTGNRNRTVWLSNSSTLLAPASSRLPIRVDIQWVALVSSLGNRRMILPEVNPAIWPLRFPTCGTNPGRWVVTVRRRAGKSNTAQIHQSFDGFLGEIELARCRSSERN